MVEPINTDISYLERYYELCGECRSNQEAFRYIELEYFAQFGCNKYKNWNSFISAMSRKHRKKKKFIKNG